MSVLGGFAYVLESTNLEWSPHHSRLVSCSFGQCFVAPLGASDRDEMWEQPQPEVMITDSYN